jgi:hypothetical protein
MRNAAAEVYSEVKDGHMLNKRAKRESDRAIRANVKREMAKPRKTKSAKIAEEKLDLARIPEQPSATVPGIVDKIIPSSSLSNPETAQIAVDGPERGYRDFRVENALTDENGDDIKLKKGSRVEVTVTEDPLE